MDLIKFLSQLGSNIGNAGKTAVKDVESYLAPQQQAKAAPIPLIKGGYAQPINADGSGGGYADAPDITYNPNPNTNIPYSAHSPELAQLGNQYVADPTNPKFLNVDPAIFGFPADNTTISPQQYRANQLVQPLFPNGNKNNRLGF